MSDQNVVIEQRRIVKQFIEKKYEEVRFFFFFFFCRSEITGRINLDMWIGG